MEGSFADELYSENLRLSNMELGPASTASDCDGDEWCGDGSSWAGSVEEHKASDLDREWQRRHEQFHTIGYRDGLMAGKEASAQEGFNIGFKESVLVGYNWGIVRGVTSALACLPNELREMLVETEEKGNKFQKLHESVHSLSTMDALKLFNDDVSTKKLVEQTKDAEPSSPKAQSHNQNSDGSLLRNCYWELQSLLESSAIEVHAGIEHSGIEQ